MFVLLPLAPGQYSLLAGILTLLIFSTGGVFSARRTNLEKHAFITGYLVIALTFISGGLLPVEDSIPAANFSYQYYEACDFYTVNMKSALLTCTGFFLSLSLEFLIRHSTRKRVNLIEFPLIICFALFFMLLLASSFNLFGGYVSLEGLTFSLYILAGMNYTSQNSLESGMKYFCLGTLSSGFLLFGVALVFLITKTLNFLELRLIFFLLEDLPLLLSFALIFIFFGF